jgi:hypothetical protein
VDLPIGALPHPDTHVVSPGYVPALGIRVLAGRNFVETDTDKAPRVGLINRAIADKFFTGVEPIGRRFGFGRVGSDQTWITIVGVVDDTRMYGLDNPSRLEVYVPFSQGNRSEAMLIVKSTGDASALVPAIRSLVASIDRDSPHGHQHDGWCRSISPVSTRQVTFVALTLFSFALALVLAAIGIYGVMSYSVAQRLGMAGHPPRARRTAHGSAAEHRPPGLHTRRHRHRHRRRRLAGADTRDEQPAVRRQRRRPDHVRRGGRRGRTRRAGGVHDSGLRALRLNPLVALRRD